MSGGYILILHVHNWKETSRVYTHTYVIIHEFHNIPVFTQESALILLRPLPAATLLRVVSLKGTLLFVLPMTVELLQSACVRVCVCVSAKGGSVKLGMILYTLIISMGITHYIPEFRLLSVLIILGRLPAATLLRVVRFRGMLVFSSFMAIGLLQSLTV